jgi:predicted MFS family arabinose efflux permease
VALVLVATLLIFLAFNLFYAGFPVHAMEAYGWDTGDLGIFFAVLSGLMVISQGPLLSFASKRLEPPVLFGLGMGLLTLSFLTYFMPAGVLTFVGAALFAVGNGLSWPTFQARVAEIGGEEQGAIQGVVTSAASAASVVGLIAGGMVYPALGGWVFVVAAALFAITGLLTPRWFGGGTSSALEAPSS